MRKRVRLSDLRVVERIDDGIRSGQRNQNRKSNCQLQSRLRYQRGKLLNDAVFLFFFPYQTSFLISQRFGLTLKKGKIFFKKQKAKIK